MKKSNFQITKAYWSNHNALFVNCDQTKSVAVMKRNINVITSDEKIATERGENEGGHVSNSLSRNQKSRK